VTAALPVESKYHRGMPSVLRKSWWVWTLAVGGFAMVWTMALGPVGCGSSRKGCACPTIFAPVCGVDGQTYGNSCEAECAGVAVARQGACVTDAGAGGQGGGTPGVSCPGPAPQGCCLKDDDCPVGNQGVQICVTTACQAGSVAGVCKPQIPSDSTQCWSDADCYGTERCVGASVCPCGAACLLADQIGHCAK